MMKKREFLKSIGLVGIASSLFGFDTTTSNDDALPYTASNQYLTGTEFSLPTLPYNTDALEPIIDKQTMEIHYGKHHKAYVDNLNKAIVDNAIALTTLEDICQSLNKKSAAALRNNAGGHWNHTFFWQSMSASDRTQIVGAKTAAAINIAFGSFDKFKEEFTKAATTRFGSGWAWLCKDKKGKLFITSTPNQDNPLMRKLVDKAGIPILGLDVWEHAYYLKYQNKRADYIKNFFTIINWDEVEKRLG